ncbi:Rossmann-like domain-containing protein [Phosphitispora sp. TUW77]|uniref:Rossmann-like domain-containing protein n=1 Tax=Phosphitispora sp. TUW77 TaxID=3152361 RepID=UPI003AB87D81
MEIPEVFKRLRPHIVEILQNPDLCSTNINITCQALSPEEAIGFPGRDDFPLQKGKETLMQAIIDGCKGQAFTDMPGNFFGTLQEALTLFPDNNYKRAVIIASLNAVLRKTGKASGTIHCKDDDLGACSKKLAEKVAEDYGNPRIAVIGLQPAMVEQLACRFNIRVFDLDPDNIGKNKYGVTIENNDSKLEAIEEWCDLFLVTGSTVVNATIDQFLNRKKPVLFYGTTISGTAQLLGLNRFCPESA